jgi:hypothetical protein
MPNMDAPNSTLSGDLFDNFSSKAKESFKSAERSADDSARKIANSFKYGAAFAGEDMATFMMGINKSLEINAKATTDTASKMFDELDKVQSKSLKASIAQSIQHHQELKKQELSSKEIVEAMAVRAFGLQKAMKGLETTSKSMGFEAKGLSKVGGLAQSYSLPQLGTVLGATGGTEILASLAGSISKIVPHLAAIGSLVGILHAIVEQTIKVDEVTNDLAKDMGGNIKVARAYYERLNGLKLATHLTADELMKMGSAFQQVGFKAIEGEGGVDSYMTVAAQMGRIFGTSNEQLAQYMVTMRASGNTAAQAHDIYSDMYVTMQSLNLTLNDLNASMTDGQELWSSFGSLGGRTLDGLQSDVLKTRGLFKAFNIDVKEVGTSIGGIFGDDKLQRRQAMFIANMLKVSQREAYNTLLLDPAKGQEMLMKSTMKYAVGRKGANFGLDSKQITALGTNGAYGTLVNQRQTMATLGRITGQSPAKLNQTILDYQGFSRTHKSATPEEWLASRKKGMSNEHTGSLDQATDQFNLSLGEQGKLIGEAIKTPINLIASNLAAFIPTATRVLTNVEKFLIDLAPKVGLGATNFAKNPIGSIGDASNASRAAISGALNQPWIAPSGTPTTAEHAKAVANMRARLGQAATTLGTVTSKSVNSGAGWLSSMFEGNTGSVAPAYRVNKKGQTYVLPGQAAYGAWQMDSGMGTPQKFMAFLKTKHPSTYAALAPYAGDMGNNRGNFAQVWKGLAKSNGKNFLAEQKEFISQRYLDPMVAHFPGLKNSAALREVAFSTAVQHGYGGAEAMFRKGGFGRVDNEAFIKNLYKQRSGVMKGGRYAREQSMALNALHKEVGGGSADHTPLIEKTNQLLGEAVSALHKGNATRDQRAEREKRLSMSGSAASATHSAAVRGNVV